MALSAKEGHTMHCIHCEGSVADGDRFCPNCGKPMEAPENRPAAFQSIDTQEGASADAAPVGAFTGGHKKKRGKRFKLVTAGVAALVAVIMVGALAWAFAAGPLQPVEARGEGQLPNVARAMTMWQDADKVEATLGVSDDEAQSYAAGTLLYYPADLQGYDGWDSLYIDTTEGPASSKGALDEVWVGFGGGPQGTLAIIQEDGKIKMYSGPAYGGTYGTGPGAENPYTYVGDLGDAPSNMQSWETPTLDGPTIAGLESALLQTGNKASYVREFSSDDARPARKPWIPSGRADRGFLPVLPPLPQHLHRRSRQRTRGRRFFERRADDVRLPVARQGRDRRSDDLPRRRCQQQRHGVSVIQHVGQRLLHPRAVPPDALCSKRRRAVHLRRGELQGMVRG